MSLFQVSGVVCHGFQRQSGSPHLHASSPQNSPPKLQLLTTGQSLWHLNSFTNLLLQEPVGIEHLSQCVADRHSNWLSYWGSVRISRFDQLIMITSRKIQSMPITRTVFHAILNLTAHLQLRVYCTGFFVRMYTWQEKWGFHRVLLWTIGSLLILLKYSNCLSQHFLEKFLRIYSLLVFPYFTVPILRLRLHYKDEGTIFLSF